MSAQTGVNNGIKKIDKAFQGSWLVLLFWVVMFWPVAIFYAIIKWKK